VERDKCPGFQVRRHGRRARSMAKIAWSEVLDGRWALSSVLNSTTRAAILIRRNRKVSNCTTRQVEHLGIARRIDHKSNRRQRAGPGETG
jgi:hypothetical protein